MTLLPTTLLPTKMVETDFGAVRVADTGPGQGAASGAAPLVFVHGYPDNLQIWSRVLAELTERRCIAFDWPGLGHSAELTGGATPFDLGRQFIAVVQALELDRVVPVGFDMGAHAVVAATNQSPELVERLVLTNFLADGDVGTSWEISVMRRLGLNRLVLRWAPRIVFAQAQRTFIEESSLTSAVRNDLWTGFSRPATLRHLQRMSVGYEASLRRVTKSLDSIEVPTLVVWADADRHFPLAQGRALDAGLANSTMRIMAGASHWFMWDRPKEFANLIRRFLDPHR